MKFFAMGLILTMLATPAFAEEKETPKFVCGPNADMEKVLDEKGYHHLLDMTAENGVVEQFWVGGQQMIATAQKDEKNLCFLTTFKNTTFNPKTIEKIYNIYKSTQKEL